MKKYFAALIIILSSCNKNAAVDTTPITAQGDILFISQRISNSADWQMFMMKADGTNQRVISNKLVRCAPPALSNSETKIAFTAFENFSYNLYIIDTNGNNLTLLSKGKQYCGDPVWSPGDNRIAFVKNDYDVAGNLDIYSINTDGSNEIKLTNQNANYSPQYFSDNRSIVFVSSNNSLASIFKMNTDGTNKQLLTPLNESFSDPKISPDGHKILITSVDWNGSQIFVMNSDGSNLKQLTFTVSSSYFDSGFPRDANNSPVWSPNNASVAYVSYENGSPDIFTINSNGTANNRLTNTPMRDESPCWTKDGNYILFSSNRDWAASSEIYIMKQGGQLQTPITKYSGEDILPAFINK